MSRRLVSFAVGGAAAVLVSLAQRAVGQSTSAQPPQQTQSAQVPSTATQRPAPLTTTATPGRQSWVSDRRDFQLGDIITIQVDEFTLTSLDKRVDATDNRQRDMALGLTTPSAAQNAGFSTRNNASSQTRGSDARNNRLVTEMSARVVEIGPNRQMRLEGTKSLHVEKSVINISLSGWTRAQDVTPQNVVSSSRLAEAKVDYQAEGPLGSAKGGILGRILGKFWP